MGLPPGNQRKYKGINRFGGSGMKDSKGIMLTRTRTSTFNRVHNSIYPSISIYNIDIGVTWGLSVVL